MKIVKLVIAFIIITGAILLAINWNNIFAPTAEEKEKIIKEYLTDEKKGEIFEEYLTDEKKGEIFEEMLAAEIKEKEEDFINSEVAQDVLAAIAEMDKQALMANEKVKDIVEKCKDKKQSNGERDTEKITKTEFEDLRRKKNNATVKAENTAKKGVEDAKEKARAEILELVIKKDYNGCLKHKQFKSLTMQERVAVENVLNYEKTKYKIKTEKPRLLKTAVNNFVSNNVFNGREITWDLLINASKAIQKMELNYRNGLDIMQNVAPL